MNFDIFKPKTPALFGLDISSSSIKMLEIVESSKGYVVERHELEVGQGAQQANIDSPAHGVAQLTADCAGDLGKHDQRIDHWCCGGLHALQ